MINIMIVDDEKHACRHLADLVSEVPGCNVIAFSHNGMEAVHKVDTLNVDLVLMDIHMPGMDGIEVARHMNKCGHPPKIIFTTAYRQHALSAFEVDAKGFLLKPVMRRQLNKKLLELQYGSRRAVREPSVKKHRSYIYCRHGKRFDLIALKDVIYFKSQNKYTLIKHTDGMNLIDQTLKELEEEFSESLIRIHRNALVNKDYMKSLENDGYKRVLLGVKGTSMKLHVSRRYIPKVRRYLRQFSTKSGKKVKNK